MPIPVTADVHVNKVMTNVGIQYKNRFYIRDQAFPIVPVKTRTNIYQVWTKEYWFRDQVEKRAPGQPAPIMDIGVDLTKTYKCETYHVRTAIDPEIRDNADSELKLQERKTEAVTDQLMLAGERRVGGVIFTTGTWGTDLELANNADKWDDPDNSDPIGDIDTALGTIEDNIAYPGNTIIFGVQVWRVIRRHPQIIALVFGGDAPGPKIVTVENFAKAFEVDNVLIGRAFHCTTKEGGTAAYTKIWGKHAWFGYVTPGASITTPSAGYIFRQFYRVRSWQDQSTEEDYIEAKEATDEKPLATDAGYYLYNVIQ